VHNHVHAPYCDIGDLPMQPHVPQRDRQQVLQGAAVVDVIGDVPKSQQAVLHHASMVRE
jgi:hypothetical protein